MSTIDEQELLARFTAAALTGIVASGKYRVGMSEAPEFDQYAEKALQVGQYTLRRFLKEQSRQS